MEMFFFWWLLVPIQFLQLSELLWCLKVTNMGMHLMPFFVVSVSSHFFSIFGEACLTIACQTPAEIRKSQLF